MTRISPYLLSAPAAALLLGLLLGPLVLLARMSLYAPATGRGFYQPGTWTAANFAAATDGFGLRLIGFTVLFAAGVAVMAVAAGYPLALFLRSLTPTARRVGVAVLLAPKLASALVVMFGLQQLLSAAGPLSKLLVAVGLVGEPVTLSRTLGAALLGEVYLVLPYAALVILLQLHRIDPNIEAVARGLGASRWQAFRRVTLPLSLPGVVVAGQLAFMWGVGAFLGPLLLGGPERTTLAVEVERQAFQYGQWPRAAAGAVLLLAAGMIGYAGLGPARRPK